MEGRIGTNQGLGAGRVLCVYRGWHPRAAFFLPDAVFCHKADTHPIYFNNRIRPAAKPGRWACNIRHSGSAADSAGAGYGSNGVEHGVHTVGGYCAQRACGERDCVHRSGRGVGRRQRDRRGGGRHCNSPWRHR